MKKILLAFLLFNALSSNAQQFRKFLFAFDVGNTIGGLNNIGLVSLEPSYRIRDNFLVGIRIEQIGIVSMVGGNNASLGSLGIDGHYYFKTGNIRPFIGIGFGLYNPSNNFIMNNSDTKNQRNGFGFYPRVGIEIKHFRIIVEHNFVQKMKDFVTISSPMVPQQPIGEFININHSYWGFKIGFFFGGGKKK